MATLELQTPEGVDLRRQIAGPGSRSAAALIDLALLVAVWFAAVLVLTTAASVDIFGVSGVLLAMLLAGSLLLLFAYPAVVSILWEGQTVGKRALGLRVVGDEGYPAEPVQHVLRSLLWVVELLVIPLFPIGLVLIALMPNRQRLGDLVAGTIVVREESRWTPDGGEPFAKETWSGLAQHRLELSAAVVADLDSSDVDLLRAVLVRRRLDSGARRRLFEETARVYARRLGLGEVKSAPAFLKELYLFLRERRTL